MSLHDMIRSRVDRGRADAVRYFGNDQPEIDPVDQLLRQEVKRLVGDQRPPANGKIRMLQAAVQQKRAMETGKIDQAEGGLSVGYPEPRIDPHEVLVSYLALAFHHSHVRLVA